jgi:hypothetical protein
MVTGIHCEATGCGKSLEILMYIDFSHKQNKNCKIILFTERVNILADLFDFEKKTNPVDLENIKLWKKLGICDLTDFEIIDRVTVKKSDWVDLINKSTKPTLLVINRAYLTMTKEYEKIAKLDLILHDECHNVASNKCFEFLKYFKSKEFDLGEKVSNDNDNIYCSSVEINSDGKKIHKVRSSKTIKSINLDNSDKSDKSLILGKKKVPIVGFSATPLRAGKTKSGDETVFNKDRLVEIYGFNNQLNLITNYNMVYAISEKLILPPKFYWFNIDNYLTKGKYNKDTEKSIGSAKSVNSDKKESKKSDKKKTKDKNEINEKENEKTKKKGQVSKSELGSVMKILDDLIPLMPNKKLVAWCGTIPLCDEWYDNFYEYKDMYENLKNIKIYKDYSKKIDDLDVAGYETFKHIESEGIMFCAQKHREGSDIKKLDGCIFLDKVKNRGPISFIQSIGRVLRKDKSPDSKKTSGFVIDGVVRDDEDYEKNIVDKILGYYFALADLANLEDYIGESNGTNVNTESNYSKYVELRELVEFDSEEKKIKLRLDETWVEINCKKLDWGIIVKNFDSILGKKVGLGSDEMLRVEFENLKKIAFKLNNKLNGNNLIDGWKKYAKKENYTIEPNKKYCKFWKGWYDFYQIDISKFPKTKTEWIKKCKKYKINYKNYDTKILEYNSLPELPNEIYQDYTNLKIELDYNFDITLDNLLY